MITPSGEVRLGSDEVFDDIGRSESKLNLLSRTKIIVYCDDILKLDNMITFKYCCIDYI